MSSLRELERRWVRVFSGRITTMLAGMCFWASLSAHGQSINAVPNTRLDPGIVASRPASLHDVNSESDLVGPAKQPEWTTRRVFAETDIYVIPPGAIEFNQFYVPTVPRSGTMEHAFESELEFGLPWRTQFDVELNYSVTNGRLRYDSTRVEIPHALANWNEIPLNPTIDGGWRVQTDEADAFFFRLLLAEEFGPRVHFGANLTYDRQVGDEHETSYEFSMALSYVVKDSKLAVGMEALFEYETKQGDDPDEGSIHSTSAMIGPSLLYKPTRNTHVGLVTLFGVTHDAPAMQAFVLFGMDFEPFGGGKSGKGGDDHDAGGFQPVRRPR